MERTGLALPPGLSPADLVECAQLAEQLGYESVWMSEGHGGDQFSILTACALATDRILLGTSITSVFVRSAPTIAMAAASVDHYSRGRCILGLGTSHRVQVGPEHGLTFSEPLQRLKECVEIIRALLRDGEVSYPGKIFNIKRFDLWFEPFRKEIPIYLAGVFPKVLQICGEISQGAMLTWCTLDHARTAAENVAIGAASAGRDAGDVDVSTLLTCAVSADRDAARDSMRASIAAYAGQFPRYRRLMMEAGFAEEVDAVRRAWNEGDREQALRLVPAGLIDKIGVVGTPEDCRKRIREYREAGITLPIVSPRFPRAAGKEHAMEIIRACAPMQESGLVSIGNPHPGLRPPLSQWERGRG